VRRKLFLSYARSDDEPFVARLYSRLQAEGFDVWYDRESMPNRGLSFTQEVRDAIDRCERLVLVAGPIALSSPYVKSEWQHALLFGRSVITILRLGTLEDLPKELQLHHIPDFRDPHSFDEVFSQLLRQLKDEPAEWGPLLTPVPTLPLPYLPRGDDLDMLTRCVLPDVTGPAVVSGTAQTTAIAGLPGIGKSMLAVAFARLSQVRRTFQDGIVWLTLGQTRPALETLRELLLACDVQVARDAAWNEVRPALSSALRDRKCLIVVDDVWNSKDLEALRNALGRFCRLVITTRITSVAESLQAQLVRLDLLSESEALAFLAASAGNNYPQPRLARELVRECGCLRLALAICGAKLKRGTLAEDLLYQLAAAKIDFLAANLPNYQYSDAYKAMQASVDALEKETSNPAKPLQATLYLGMAVFSADELLPESVLMMWWRSRSSKNEPELREMLIDLADQHLLRLDGQAPNRTISLHDLQFDYLHARSTAEKGSAQGIHRDFIEAYRAVCHGNWTLGPDDDYFFLHLGYHLVKAGLVDELGDLLGNFDWLNRVSSISIRLLLADFDRLPSTRSRSLVRRAIHQSTPALADDSSQLAGQLLGRLGDTKEDDIKLLLSAARKWQGRPWLRPLQTSLITPDFPLNLVLSGHEGRVRTLACSPDGRTIVTASNSSPDQTIRVWSLDSGLELHCLEKEAPQPLGTPGVTPLAFACDNEHFLSAVGNQMRVWNCRNGKLERTITAHSAPIVAITAARLAPYAASIDDKGSLRLWDTETWEDLRQIESTAQPFYSLALSPDGSRMACAGADLLDIFDATTGRRHVVAERTGFDAHWGLQPPLSFRDDNSVLFWGRPLRYFDFARNGWSLVDTKEKEKALDITTSVASTGDFALDISTFPRLVFLDEQRSVSYLVVYADDEPQPKPSCALIIPGNRAIAVCGEDHRIEIWNIPQLMGLRKMHRVGSGDFFFSEDSRYLLTRSATEYGVLSCEDGLAHDEPPLLAALRQQAESQRKMDVQSEPGSRTLACSPEGTLTTAAPRGKYGERAEPDEPGGWPVKFYPIGQSDRPVEMTNHSLPVYAGAIFPGGRGAATGGQGRVIRVWELPAGIERYRLRGHRDTIWALAVSPDPNQPWLLSCSHDRTARLWDYRRGVHVATFTADRSLRRAGVSRDGHTLVAGQGSVGPLHLLRLEDNSR
jgi:WD40 repeat protein